MRILYVEDNPLDADLTMRMLRKSAPQLQLETVSTITESLSRLESIASDPIDLVLIDKHLRDGDGLSLLKHIREKSLPLAVVLITGAGDEETAVAALKGRADDYIIKRKDYLDRLPVTLESALSHYRAEAARLSNPLNVLYLERDQTNAEKTSGHFVVHASHIHLELVSTWSAALLALQSTDAHSYDVVVMNLLLRDLNALEILKEFRLTHGHDVPVVLLCEPGDDELARQGLKLGASSYLIKNPGYLYQLPWELEQAHARADLQRREAALHASEESLRRALAEVQQLKDRLHQENIYLQEEIRVASNFGEIIGNSETLRRCLRQAEQVAPLDTTVLILGETGTGKELLAHAIHKLSPRARHPLVRQTLALKRLASEIERQGGWAFPLTHTDDPTGLQVYLDTYQPPAPFEQAAVLLRGSQPAYVAGTDWARLEALRQPGDPPVYTLLQADGPVRKLNVRIVSNRPEFLSPGQ